MENRQVNNLEWLLLHADLFSMTKKEKGKRAYDRIPVRCGDGE